MPESRPQVSDEAVLVLAACMACRDPEMFRELVAQDPDNYEWKLREAQGYLERCLPAVYPAIRAEVEADLRERLLGDEAVEAAFEAFRVYWVKGPGETPHEAFHAALEAALDSISSQGTQGEACERCGHDRSKHGPFRNSATAFCSVQTCRCFDFVPAEEGTHHAR